MKKIIIFIAFMSIFESCSPISGGLKVLPNPEPDKVMVVGCILLENIDLDFNFQYWTLPLKVVIIGKGNDGKILHFSTMTDDKGYYGFPNLPKANYILKAVVFQEPGNPQNIIVNDWNTEESKFYLMRHPERGIEYKANLMFEGSIERLQNHHIIWFGLRHAIIENMSMKTQGDVLFKRIKNSLNSKYLWVGGHLYTREEPMIYFKKKFPNSKWW